MGVGEVEELLKREEKRQEKRRLKMAKRKVRKERAQTFWKGMTDALCTGRQLHPQINSHDGVESSDSTSTQSGSDGGERW